MTMKAETFDFTSYKILDDKKTITFNFKISFEDKSETNFSEKIVLPKEIPDAVDRKALASILESLHLILGISYWKTYCPKNITLPYQLSKEQSKFWDIVYTKGLGQFFYENKIDYRGLINFPIILKTCSAGDSSLASDPRRYIVRNDTNSRYLVGIGGGKDSIVAVELLKSSKKNITGYILKEQNNSNIKEDVLKVMQIDCLYVQRFMDEKLIVKNALPSSYNGHIPISAIYAFVGILLALCYGYSFVVTGNGKSANVGNVEYLGEMINHEWSKSEEFEKMFRKYISNYIAQGINFYSILRQYTELDITKEFVRYDAYFHNFSSCNKNFRVKGNQMNKKWCGECPKCAFTFTMLAAYLPKVKVIEIFGKNLFADDKLIDTYKGLLGIDKIKPFDCVGTFEETNEAFEIIQKKGEYKDDVVLKMFVTVNENRRA